MASVQIDPEATEMLVCDKVGLFLKLCIEWVKDLEEWYGNGFSLRFAEHSGYPTAEFRLSNKILARTWYCVIGVSIWTCDETGLLLEKLTSLHYKKRPRGYDVFRESYVALLEGERDRINNVLGSLGPGAKPGRIRGPCHG